MFCLHFGEGGERHSQNKKEKAGLTFSPAVLAQLFRKSGSLISVFKSYAD